MDKMTTKTPVVQPSFPRRREPTGLIGGGVTEIEQFSHLGLSLSH